MTSRRAHGRIAAHVRLAAYERGEHASSPDELKRDLDIA
jgi:hypothetical protein